MAVQTQSARAFFTQFNVVASHFHYTSGAAGIAATSGWVKADYNNVIVQYRIATMTNADPLLVRVEGKFDSPLDRPASILYKSIPAHQHIDALYTITDKVKYIRMGARLTQVSASLTGSSCLFYAGVGFTDVS